MPSYYEIVPPFTQFFDGNGNPLSGGKLYTYTGGTSSNKTTYREIDAVTANANPIVLDSSGYTPYGVYGTTGSYKLVLKTSADVTVRTRDHVYGINDVNNRGWVLLSSQVASSSSSIDFTSFSSSYNLYEIHCYGVVPATDGANFYIRTSANAGTSYDAGASDYQFSFVYGSTAGSATAAGDASAAQIEVATVGSSTGESLSLKIRLAGLSGTRYKMLEISGGTYNATPTFVSINGMGMRASTSAIDGVRLLFSSGNISAGTFKLFGLAES